MSSIVVWIYILQGRNMNLELIQSPKTRTVHLTGYLVSQ